MATYDSETKAIIGARNLATISQEPAYVRQTEDLWTGKTVWQAFQGFPGVRPDHCVEPLAPIHRLAAIADQHGESFEQNSDGSLVIDGQHFTTYRDLMHHLGY